MKKQKVALYIRREGTGFPDQIITDGPVIVEHFVTHKSLANTKRRSIGNQPAPDVTFIFSQLTGEVATFTRNGAKGRFLDVGVTCGDSLDIERVEVVEEMVDEWAHFCIDLPEDSRVARAIRMEGAAQLAKHDSELGFMYLLDRAGQEAGLVLPGE